METLAELPYFSSRYIPLDVAERIIDELSWHVQSLRSCALTCRGWHPRARLHLMASICIRSREHLQSFCEYIASTPLMASVVRSLSMSPGGLAIDPLYLLEIVPVDLLQRLPNLHKYSIADESHMYGCKISFYATTLAQIKAYLLVAELELRSVKFRTSAELARVLSALPRLRCLKCMKVRVKAMTAHAARYRNKCSLAEVTILSPIGNHIVGSILQLCSPGALNILHCELNDSFKDNTPDLSPFKNLHSLQLTTIKSPINARFREIVLILTTLGPNTLRTLTISIACAINFRRSPDEVSLSLEDAILALGKPSVIFSIPWAKCNTLAQWSKLFRARFPRLQEGKLFGMPSLSFENTDCLGHDSCVTAIASSPVRGYIATNATDGTIIIWSGTTPPQRILMEMLRPPEQRDSKSWPESLRFSDNGEFLAGMCRTCVFIWRVCDGAHISTITSSKNSRIRVCTWQKHGLHHLPQALSIVEYEEEFTSVMKVYVRHPLAVSTTECVTLLPPDNIRLYYEIIVQSSSGLYVAAFEPHAAVNKLVPRRHSKCFIWQTITSAPSCKPRGLNFGRPFSAPQSASFVGETQLVLGFHDGTIRWWDISSFPLANAKPRGILMLPASRRGASTGIVRFLSVSPRHSFLVALCSTRPTTVAVLQPTNTPTAQGTLSGDFQVHLVLRGHTRTILTACFSPCERYIAAPCSNTGDVYLWRTSDGELLWTFRDHSETVVQVAFSHNGRILASADSGGRVCLHSLSRFVDGAPVPSVLDDE